MGGANVDKLCVTTNLCSDFSRGRGGEVALQLLQVSFQGYEALRPLHLLVIQQTFSELNQCEFMEVIYISLLLK